MVTCSHKTSAVHSPRLNGRPGATRVQTAKGNSVHWGPFSSPGMNRGEVCHQADEEHVTCLPASVPYHQGKLLLIARRLLNNLKEARAWPLHGVSAGWRKQRRLHVCTCVLVYNTRTTQHKSWGIFAHPCQWIWATTDEKSNSFVSLLWRPKNSDVGGVCKSRLHFCAGLTCMTFLTKKKWIYGRAESPNCDTNGS